ncbi:hypothetical protein [Clostridium ganghwense]|uniref:Uncharacterized protein n=1 Tax=Clostridium ganghwense TaxID=312089 RepID=A0ABT4CQX3_9CLOT|nr:hypothetical protein [Clostridium ganghwense]MCY6371470.1 hypothetical protein [Clostridium ganghwense]
MNNYIWINPVVEQMYKNNLKQLINELNIKGYKVVKGSCQQKKVKNKFMSLCKKIDNHIILDTRCPAAVDYIKQNIELDGIHIPQIEPILIHAARELFDLYIKKDERATLTITTPCESLKELGKNIFKQEGKDRIFFKTWNEMCETFNIEKVEKCLESPIPLGFFKELGQNVLELSGKKEMIEGVTRVINNEVNARLIEMLLCKEGCNNGDGV